jgi:hypothetical protein
MEATTRTTMKTKFATAWIGALALLAGCGGDEGSDGLSKTEYIARANAVCTESAKQAEGLYSQVIGDRAKTPKLAQEFLTRLVDVFGQSVEDRTAIPAPEGDEQEIERINVAGEEATEGFREAATSPNSAADLMRGITPDPAEDYDRLSDEYGIEQCAGKD